MSLLNSKLPAHLKRLAMSYERDGDTLRHELITTGSYFLRKNTDYDNWNGGIEGHTVVLFSPLEVIGEISPHQLTETAQQIRDDLQKLCTVENEFYSAVALEGEDENDIEFQQAVSFLSRSGVNPDRLQIWKSGLARIFVSHRDKYKVETRNLADALENYGLSCFVAHETIPADEEWQKIILGGLDTMEAMVAIITDDFHESYWTMQEVGFAVAKGVPVIALKVGKKDPPGFISHKQALKGSLSDPIRSAQNLFPLIGNRLRKQDRFTEVLVNSFCGATDFNEAKDRFERMKANIKKLPDTQVDRIVGAFGSNAQLHRAGHLTSKFNRLINFLNDATDGEWYIDRKHLINRSAADDSDEVPF